MGETAAIGDDVTLCAGRDARRHRLCDRQAPSHGAGQRDDPAASAKRLGPTTVGHEAKIGRQRAPPTCRPAARSSAPRTRRAGSTAGAPRARTPTGCTCPTRWPTRSEGWPAGSRRSGRRLAELADGRADDARDTAAEGRRRSPATCPARRARATSGRRLKRTGSRARPPAVESAAPMPTVRWPVSGVAAMPPGLIPSLVSASFCLLGDRMAEGHATPAWARTSTPSLIKAMGVGRAQWAGQKTAGPTNVDLERLLRLRASSRSRSSTGRGRDPRCAGSSARAGLPGASGADRPAVRMHGGQRLRARASTTPVLARTTSVSCRATSAPTSLPRRAAGLAVRAAGSPSVHRSTKPYSSRRWRCCGRGLPRVDAERSGNSLLDWRWP